MNPAPTVVAGLAVLALGTALATEPPAAPSATPVKHATLKSCNREATAKKLSGKDRERYVKDCLAPRPAADAKASAEARSP